jgi:hypothetical protein
VIIREFQIPCRQSNANLHALDAFIIDNCSHNHGDNLFEHMIRDRSLYGHSHDAWLITFSGLFSHETPFHSSNSIISIYGKEDKTSLRRHAGFLRWSSPGIIPLVEDNLVILHDNYGAPRGQLLA